MNETFELSDKKLYSTIEKEFIRLFGPGNTTSSNVTSSNTTSGNSNSTIQPLSLKTNMTRISQAYCEKLIPDSFDFKKLVPESFTNSTSGNASKEMNEGETFLRHRHHRRHHHHHHHHHHHRRHHHHHHGWWR
jgi:hypothetical protein